MTKHRLNELKSGSNIDKVDSEIDKAKKDIQKAQDAILDICDSYDKAIKAVLTAESSLKKVSAEATITGGIVASMVPQQVQSVAQQLVTMAQTLGNQMQPVSANTEQLNPLNDMLGNLQSSLENIPYGKYKEPSDDVRRALLLQSAAASGEPQSAIMQEDASLEDFYRGYLREEIEENIYESNQLSFNQLKENQVFGQILDNEMMGVIGMKQAAVPIQAKAARQQIREVASINDSAFEEIEDRSNEKLAEGSFFNGSLKAFAGSDGMPLSFNTLREGSEALTHRS